VNDLRRSNASQQNFKHHSVATTTNVAELATVHSSTNELQVHVTTLAVEDDRKKGNGNDAENDSISTWDELSHIEDIDPDINKNL
jgi:hypothetical protein